jgi:hypothetical protein
MMRALRPATDVIIPEVWARDVPAIGVLCGAHRMHSYAELSAATDLRLVDGLHYGTARRMRRHHVPSMTLPNATDVPFFAGFTVQTAADMPNFYQAVA